jgi:hypothetical protein
MQSSSAIHGLNSSDVLCLQRIDLLSDSTRISYQMPHVQVSSRSSYFPQYVHSAA